MNVVARAQLTVQMLTLLHKYVYITIPLNTCAEKLTKIVKSSEFIGQKCVYISERF